LPADEQQQAEHGEDGYQSTIVQFHVKALGAM
jgi:hypothetical protein